MPTKQEHIRRANLDEEFASEVLSYLDRRFHYWAVTAFFYSALHWVDAYLDARFGSSYHPTSHRIRTGYITKDSNLKRIWIEYRFLQEASRDARYETQKFNPQSIREVKNRQSTVKEHIASLLGN